MMGYLQENPDDRFPVFTNPKTKDGKTAYEVLDNCPECPIRLPRARSMTQAKIDYEHRAERIVNWYNQKY
jgi:hypothetical protein